MADTRTSDKTYDLISVAYHALQGAETYEQYISDAETRDDQEVAEFFRQVHDNHVKNADRAKELLQSRLSQ